MSVSKKSRYPVDKCRCGFVLIDSPPVEGSSSIEVFFVVRYCLRRVFRLSYLHSIAVLHLFMDSISFSDSYVSCFLKNRRWEASPRYSVV